MVLNKRLITISGILLLAVISNVWAEEQGSAAESQNETSLNTLAKRASERLLMDIKQIVAGRLITVGERGHILVSDDQGEQWRQIQVPTNALLTKMFFIDDKVGWVVGHNQTILKTTSAGEQWEVQHSSDNLDQPALFDIWFADKQNGVAIGAYGLYLTTSDGGKTWQEVYQENLEDEEIGFPHFYSLAKDSNGRLYMAGELGFLAASEDNGATWVQLESPYDGSFFNMMVAPDDSLLVMGLRGHLFRSEDKGVNWTEIETGTISGLQEAVLLSDKRILIVGSDGTQLVSDDMGKSVKLDQRSDRIHLANAIGLKDGQIMIVGIQGALKTQLK